jgi:hypothetical protein
LLCSIKNATIGVKVFQLNKISTVMTGNHLPLLSQNTNVLLFIICVISKDKKLPSMKTNLVLLPLITIYLLLKVLPLLETKKP